MNKNKPFKMELQRHAVKTQAIFDPDNVMMMDSLTGNIPSEQGEWVVDEIGKKSIITQLAKYEPMTKPIKTFGFYANGPGAYWVGEGQRIETSKAQWLTVEMEAKKLAVIIPVTAEQMQFSMTNFFTAMRPLIAKAFLQKFDQAALFGENSPYKPGTSIYENIVSSGNVIAKGDGGNLYQDFNNLLSLVEAGGKDPNGIATTTRFNHDLRGAVDNQGLPIFNNVHGNVTKDVMGLPIAYSELESWDQEKAELIIGDWDQAVYGILQDIDYRVFDSGTISTVVGEDGAELNLMERDMYALRATMHIGFMTVKEDAFAALTPVVEP